MDLWCTKKLTCAAPVDREMCFDLVEAFSAIYGRLAFLGSLNRIEVVALYSNHLRMGVDRLWAQILLRFYHDSSSWYSLGDLSNEIPDLIIALRIEPITDFMSSHTHYMEDRNVLIFLSNSTALGYDL